jgi:hypothetical protein
MPLRHMGSQFPQIGHVKKKVGHAYSAKSGIGFFTGTSQTISSNAEDRSFVKKANPS